MMLVRFVVFFPTEAMVVRLIPPQGVIRLHKPVAQMGAWANRVCHSRIGGNPQVKMDSCLRRSNDIRVIGKTIPQMGIVHSRAR